MDKQGLTKRKPHLGGLQRRVRARKEPEPEPDSDEVLSNESDEDQESDHGDEINGSAPSSSDGDEDEDSDEAEEEDPTSSVTAASQISFGALAKAQASLPSARDKKNKSRHAARNGDEEHDDDDDDDDRRPSALPTSKPKTPKPHRSSKHAPTEQTSKRPVTRRREVVSYAKVAPRDPRFSAAVSAKGGGQGALSAPADEERARRAYAFLDGYRDAEMAQLREALRKTRDPGAREELKRALSSIQGRRQAQERKDAERALVADHRRQERELVSRGKKPFYLKKSEQRKQLLVDRFAGMKKKQVDRTIERRRKKMASRERRDMPFTRREAR